MALNGWIILDKPVGLGSTQAVAAVRRVMRQAGHSRTRVGHGGTLDPLASGVLPIAIGEATKLVGRVLDAVKSYDFTIRFGEETDTLDLEGQIVATSDRRPSREEVVAVLPLFTGPIRQMPPAHSALKVDGRRAYDLARSGETPRLNEREVTVHSLAVTEARADQATLSATVSKGTYIRSLARDIARALGTVGHLVMLRRTRAEPFDLSQVVSMDELNAMAEPGRLEQSMLPVAAGFGDMPRLLVDEGEARRLRSGQRISGHAAAPGTYIALEGDLPVALVQLDGGEFSVVRGFNL
jgi:tRNA pseudouridine55 synthase